MNNPDDGKKKYIVGSILHVVDGIRTTVKKGQEEVEASSTDEAEAIVSDRIINQYKKMSHIGLSSLLVTAREESTGE